MRRSRAPRGRAGALAAILLFVGSTLLSGPALTPSQSAAPTHFSGWLLPGNGSNPIQHIIMVMQENHVYDTFFGTYCQAVGPYCDVNGTGIPPGTCVPHNPANLSQGCQAPYLAAPGAVTAPVDLVHDWAPAHQAYDNGSMDGFYYAENHQNSTFLYYNGAEIPTYWDIAEQYGIADNFFASALSYSTPNHWYLVAGASPPQGVNQSLNRAAPGSTRLTPAEQNYLNQANTTPTIANLLANTTVSWKYYDYALASYNQAINLPSGAGSQGSAFDFWNPFASQASSYSAAMTPHFAARSSFFTDAAAGTLPNVSWVIPSFNESDHPSASLDTGQAWIASIVNAVEASPDWNSSAIFVTWDDYGGYYDNVPPPPVDGIGLSFRAPLLVISPYAREGYISHQFTYFESLLHFVEWRYGLPSLTSRDANAPLPLDYFDFNTTPRAPIHINPPLQATYPAPLQGLGVPRVLTELTATAGSSSATLNWTLSAEGAAVTAYQVTYGPASNPTLYKLRGDGSLTSVTISNLQPGSLYQFSVQSITGANASAPVTAAATPLAGSSGLPPGQPATWSPLPAAVGPSPAARTGGGFVYDSTDHTDVLFGGESSTGAFLSDTWEYSGGHWTLLAATHPPAARAFAAMSYDSKDGYVLLFGGLGAHGYLGDTWKFVGGTWTNITSAVMKAGPVPSARAYAAISDNPGASSVLLFGGKSSTAVLGDSWRYVTGKWTNLNLRTNPPARWGAAMTYDAKDAYPVLQGGNASSSSAILNDTWRYSGASWHLVTSLASPGPRVGATMVYDAVDQYVVLFGGNRSGTLVSGTWRYVGGGWTLLNPTSAPALRQFASATFDGLHQGVLLGFGAGAAGDLVGLSEYSLPLSVALSSSPGFGDAPVLETFFPAPAGGMVPYRYLWSFGDGTNSTLIDATHEFRVPGVFLVTLTITDAVGVSTSASEYVSVDGALGVSASVDHVGANGTVAFDSAVGGGDGPYEYSWAFGDGLPTTSAAADPVYQYSAPGTYTATVQVTDSDDVTAEASVTVSTNGGEIPVAIVANVTSGDAPMSVGFTASVPAGNQSYSYGWDFGDGTPNSTAPAPSHNFTIPGTYVVSLNVTNASGAWGTSFVAITALRALTVHATYRPLRGTNVAFTATVSGGRTPYQVRWLFGDGDVSHAASPTHSFGQPGTYTVAVTVTDTFGSRSDQTISVTVGGSGSGEPRPAAVPASAGPHPVPALAPPAPAAPAPPSPPATPMAPTAARWDTSGPRPSRAAGFDALRPARRT